MASLILALPPRVEDALLRDVVEAGHTVLARVTGAAEVISAVRATAIDPLHLVIAASATTLDRDVLAALDDRGARAVAVASSEADRRNAQTLGHHEVVDEGATWREIEELLLSVRPLGAATGRTAAGVRREDAVASHLEMGSPERFASDDAPDRARLADAGAGRPARDADVRADPHGGRDGVDGSSRSGGSSRTRSAPDRRARPLRARLGLVRRPRVPAPILPEPDRDDADDAVGRGRPAGRVIAVWGPQGAPGRTTTALAVAGEVAAAGRSAVLVDADVHGGTVAATLGLLDEAPGFAAACRLAAADSLTVQELERIAQHHPSTRAPGFSVLTGISRPDRWPELAEGRVSAVLQACRGWRDYTVVDASFNLEDDEEISSDMFAPRRNAATHAVLRGADHVVAVVSADTVGLSRFFRAYVQLLEIVDPSRVSVLVNRVRPSAGGWDAASQVRRTLFRFGSVEAAAYVPEDRESLDAAVLAGATLRDVAPRSPALVEWSRFTRTTLLPPEDAPRRVRRAEAARRRGVDPAGEAPARPA
ncbi:MinD-like ATPase involved in chromosome partitioning or flagellar assembly [Clavibacter michiganensis]|uniref:AAA family ATPase n=1 Tax=Clavibacter michiganensis TaxID=28447 RepID=UPI00195E8E3E|nr:septum formation inhibitor-activating ATPase [Clavibacter michiganensis]MBM7410227.1 MinD-like ATPase involved in chromosome partitioning or flagellar assembly [Clavibacter michiganensis]